MRITLARALGLFALALGVRVLLLVLYPDPAYVTQMLSELARVHDGVFLGTGQ